MNQRESLGDVCPEKLQARCNTRFSTKLLAGDYSQPYRRTCSDNKRGDIKSFCQSVIPSSRARCVATLVSLSVAQRPPSLYVHTDKRIVAAGACWKGPSERASGSCRWRSMRNGARSERRCPARDEKVSSSWLLSSRARLRLTAEPRRLLLAVPCTRQCPSLVSVVIFRSVHSVVQSVGLYHRVSTRHGRFTRRFVESPFGYAREWSTVCCSVPRATPTLSLSLSLSFSRCSVQTETSSVCALASLVGQDRAGVKERENAQRSLILASGTWNRTALCFSSQAHRSLPSLRASLAGGQHLGGG